MRNKIAVFTIAGAFALAMTQCKPAADKADAGRAGIVDDVSQKNIVQIAIGSKDHTTLVAAVQAADLVEVLSGEGPYTVFAPTNAAFEKLPKGTVEGLLAKPDDLRDVLYNHVMTSTRKVSFFKDGSIDKMFGNMEVQIANKDGKMVINGANVVASVPASNGIVHVVDAVLLPLKK